MNSMNCRKYTLGKNRYRELYYFCQQYGEWKEELRSSTHTVKSATVSDMPVAHTVSDQTGELVRKRMELQKKIDLIEAAAEEAAPRLKDFIIKAVTNTGITYTYLNQIMEMPCGRNMYYETRRKFYWILDKKLREVF